jgi:hypothetical protein
MKVLIGKAPHENVSLDVDKLLSSRLLVQANSGKGKSHLLRRIAEQLFGKIQIIIIDPEGEFATLREKYGYVLVGKGGETPADPRSAGLVAHKLLELRASAVCDLYEMKPATRHEWVKKFLEAMIDAPKNLWHPCIVIVDEAHVFCPEKGAGESEASDAMIGLATRGRKRGFACIFATQRLGKLRKDAAAELLNVMIGGTFIDVDRKRAADALGVYGAEVHKFFDEIKVMERGYFYTLGPALSLDRILCHVGDVETSHPEAGSAKHAAEPPPPPEAIAKLLPKLSDLPREAEEKARTEGELRKEIRELKAQLRTQPKPTVDDSQKVRELEQLVKALTAYAGKTEDFIADQATAMGNAIGVLERMCKIQPPDPDLRKVAKIIPKYIPAGVSFVHPKPFTPENRPKPAIASAIASNGDLTGPERRILKALGELLSIGKEAPPKNMVAGWAGYSPIGGAFGNPIGKLRSSGLLDYPTPGTVALTESGRAAVGPCDPPSREEILGRIEQICTGPEWKILSALIEHGPEQMTKEDLAAASGYSPVGGAFGNPIGALRSKGLLDYPRPGTVKLSEWLAEF